MFQLQRLFLLVPDATPPREPQINVSCCWALPRVLWDFHCYPVADVMAIIIIKINYIINTNLHSPHRCCRPN